MFMRIVVPGKLEYRQREFFGELPEEWKEYSSRLMCHIVGVSEEHPTMPKVFVDPTDLHFTVHKSKGSLAMTRTEVYENE